MKFLYRKNGGQVVRVTTEDGFGPDNTYFETLDAPATPDGPALVPPKKWDGSVIRNATAQELLEFETARVADALLVEREAAKATLGNKTFKALVAVLCDVVNDTKNDDKTLLDVADVLAAVETKIDSGVVEAVVPNAN